MKGSPAALAKEWRRRERALDGALKRGLSNAAIEVDRAQVDNLRGGDAVGEYPIPVRTGNLLGSHFHRVRNTRLAVVGNKADYAVNVHEGKGSSEVHGRRPFLDDAAEQTDTASIMAVEVRKTWH